MPASAIDINRADFEELAGLCGVERARDLVDNRPFDTWEEIEDIPGFNEGDVDDLRRTGAYLGGGHAEE